MARPLLASNDALIARAARFKKIEHKPVPRSGWHDTAEDNWGGRARSPLGRSWAGGNCLKSCVASLANVDAGDCPDPSELFASSDWLDRYDKRLQARLGVRLEKLDRSCCPPRDQARLWVATLRMPGDYDDHCVVARGHYVVHDPAGELRGQLPMDRLVDGLLVVPAARFVPNLSPQGTTASLVPA